MQVIVWHDSNEKHQAKGTEHRLLIHCIAKSMWKPVLSPCKRRGLELRHDPVNVLFSVCCGGRWLSCTESWLHPIESLKGERTCWLTARLCIAQHVWQIPAATFKQLVENLLKSEACYSSKTRNNSPLMQISITYWYHVCLVVWKISRNQKHDAFFCCSVINAT